MSLVAPEVGGEWRTGDRLCAAVALVVLVLFVALYEG